MNDAVDRSILEREAMDAGFPGSLGLSVVAHLVLAVAALAAPYLLPREPLLRVADGFAVALPRGGGGPPEPPASAPAPQEQAPAPAPLAPEPQKVLKPPKEEQRYTKGIPELDAKKKKKADRPTPARAGGLTPGGSAPSGASGLDIGPPGPGVPDGEGDAGDWYVVAVIQKIRAIWFQQMLAGGMPEPVVIRLTIRSDGSVTDIAVVQSSGVMLADQAAQRAIYSAAPFQPLPKDHGIEFPLQLRFHPPAR